jgi:hypothetical protein
MKVLISPKFFVKSPDYFGLKICNDQISIQSSTKNLAIAKPTWKSGDRNLRNLEIYVNLGTSYLFLRCDFITPYFFHGRLRTSDAAQGLRLHDGGLYAEVIEVFSGFEDVVGGFELAR